MSIFKTFSENFIQKNSPRIDKINKLYKSYENWSKKEILNYVEELQNTKTIYQALEDVFALVKVVASRVLNKTHFDEQLLGGIALFENNIVEMKTGEGKTFTLTCPVILRALFEDTVHIVTSNDYLAQRDCELMSPLYNYFQLSASFIKTGMSTEEKKEAYFSNICYGSNHEFVFDYLRDNIALSTDHQVQGYKKNIICDEVDIAFIQEAIVPLIISGPNMSVNIDLYEKLKFLNDEFDKLIVNEDYTMDLKSKKVYWETLGVKKIEKKLQDKGIINGNLHDKDNIFLFYILNNLLKAHKVMIENEQYCIINHNRIKKVMIIDPSTGRIADGKQFSFGLHQAIELKHRLPISRESVPKAIITYPNYFKLYENISGTTGTAIYDKDEFWEVFHLNVIVIPTHKPCIRKDHDPILLRTKNYMYKEVIALIKEKHIKQQPLLICTKSVGESETLYELIKDLPVVLLNAKNHAEEADIIASAGKKGSVVISTNMAGRGVDILLGGDSQKILQPLYEELDSLDKDDDRQKIINEIHSLELKYDANKTEVMTIGGLCVIIIGAADSVKTEKQIIGRSGRQGDPGESHYFICLEDDLFADITKNPINMTFVDLFFPIHLNKTYGSEINELLRNAQYNLNTVQSETRTSLLKYDNYNKYARDSIFRLRNIILNHEKPIEILKEIFHSQNKNEYSSYSLNSQENIRKILLKNLDNNWEQLLKFTEEEKRIINLVSYEQKNRFFEYGNRLFNQFQIMMNNFGKSLINNNNDNDFNMNLDNLFKFMKFPLGK